MFRRRRRRRRRRVDCVDRWGPRSGAAGLSFLFCFVFFLFFFLNFAFEVSRVHGSVVPLRLLRGVGVARQRERI